MTDLPSIDAPGQSWDDLLAALGGIVRRAGEAVLDVYRGDFSVSRKTDASPVTEADIASERVIIAALKDLTPSVPVVSEEAFCQGGAVDVSAGTFWLVDPLDGTKEFVKRNGEFAINIGLVVQGRPRLGIIYGPVSEQLYAARPGLATLEENGSLPRPIAARRPPASGLVVLTSRSHRSPDRFDEFVKPLPVAELRPLGSALKMGVIAAGEADLYPRFGRTMEWDTAAGHAILDAAGGRLVRPDGSPLAYGKSGFENPSFVAWGRP